MLQFGPKAQLPTLSLSNSRIPLTRTIQLMLSHNHIYIFSSVRCLIDALKMPLIFAGHAAFACAGHYILHRKAKRNNNG